MMETVKSKDGTLIAYQRSGAGSPLVLVHGSTADHTRWGPVLPALEAKFTVYAVDRRGRGGSSDTEPYAIEREFEDIAAVVDSISGRVDLLGHSYGGICSLETALRAKNLRRLILYEPPIPTGVENPYPPDVVAEMRQRFAAGDRDGVVTLFMEQIVHAPPQDLEMLKSAPAWKGRLAAAHTIFRELENSNTYRFAPEKFKRLKLPVLLLQGGDSPSFLKNAINKLHEALPGSRIVVMPGQQHTAMNTAPDLFVHDVMAFLDGSG